MPEIYSNVSVHPVVRPHLVGSYFNASDAIENHNRMQYYGIAPDKYWLTQRGYFRIKTTVELGIDITYRKLLFCHSISEESADNKNSTGDYNIRTVYD